MPEDMTTAREAVDDIRIRIVESVISYGHPGSAEKTIRQGLVQA